MAGVNKTFQKNATMLAMRRPKAAISGRMNVELFVMAGGGIGDSEGRRLSMRNRTVPISGPFQVDVSRAGRRVEIADKM
jgi:hypothetical protein